jgi:hypothetical protein
VHAKVIISKATRSVVYILFFNQWPFGMESGFLWSDVYLSSRSIQILRKPGFLGRLNKWAQIVALTYTYGCWTDKNWGHLLSGQVCSCFRLHAEKCLEPFVWTGSLVNIIMNVRVAVNQHPAVNQSGWMVTRCPGFFHWFMSLC